VEIERTNPNVLTLRHNGTGEGYEQWYLLIGDVHWDNPLCNRKLLTRHLDEAKAKDAGILCVGDWYCAMQGKYDPRADKSMLRPEHQTEPYLDALVDTAAEYLEPYAEHIVMLADGNHETSIRRKLETDLLERLAHLLHVPHMGYSGFVRYMFAMKDNRGRRTRRVMYWHHGSGGGGPVTKGTIQSNRRAVMLRDTDIVVSGHIHEQWMLIIPQVWINTHGKMMTTEQWHVQVPTYKQEFTPEGGFHVERGRPPKPLGGWWLHFYHENGRPGDVGFEMMTAK